MGRSASRAERRHSRGSVLLPRRRRTHHRWRLSTRRARIIRDGIMLARDFSSLSWAQDADHPLFWVAYDREKVNVDRRTIRESIDLAWSRRVER